MRSEGREFPVRADEGGVLDGASRSARETVEMFNPVFSAISRIFGMLIFTPLGRALRLLPAGFLSPIYDRRLVLF